MPPWLYQELTSIIIAAYYAVFRALKHRSVYSEANFTEALRLELQQRGQLVRTQATSWRTYRGRRIGNNRVDLIVDGKVAIEIKKARLLKDEHAVQLRTYLDDGQLAVGLLLNFGGDDPEFRRVENHNSPAYRHQPLGGG